MKGMRKLSKKLFHCFEIAAFCGDDTKMFLEIHILHGMPTSVTSRSLLFSRQLCPILYNSMDVASQASLSLTVSQSLPKFMFIESVMPSQPMSSSSSALSLSQHQGLF